MNEKKEKDIKNNAIYLDTNILFPFSISLEHPLFQILLKISKRWNFSINIPEMAYFEWINKKKEDIEVNINKLKSIINDLKKNYQINTIDLDKISSEEIFEKSKNVLDEKIISMKINVIKSCNINIEKLIDMSLKKDRPFEEKGEKGFKDSVILFTILGHAKSENNRCSFIANDRVFAHEDVKQISKEEGVDFIIYHSIEEFKTSIESMELNIIQKVRAQKLAWISTDNYSPKYP